jgi:hypothetical protein
MYYAGQYGLASVYCLFAVENDEKRGRKTAANDNGLLEDIFSELRSIQAAHSILIKLSTRHLSSITG